MLHDLRNDCIYQPYWWNEAPNSSPARGMVLAHHLHELICRHTSVWSAETEPLKEEIIQETTVSLSAAEMKSESGTEIQCTYSRSAFMSTEMLRSMFEQRDEALERLSRVGKAESVEVVSHDRSVSVRCVCPSSLLQSMEP